MVWHHWRGLTTLFTFRAFEGRKSMVSRNFSIFKSLRNPNRCFNGIFCFPSHWVVTRINSFTELFTFQAFLGPESRVSRNYFAQDIQGFDFIKFFFTSQFVVFWLRNDGGGATSSQNLQIFLLVKVAFLVQSLIQSIPIKFHSHSWIPHEKRKLLRYVLLLNLL